KQKTTYEMATLLEFRRVLFRSAGQPAPGRALHLGRGQGRGRDRRRRHGHGLRGDGAAARLQKHSATGNRADAAGVAGGGQPLAEIGSGSCRVRVESGGYDMYVV